MGQHKSRQGANEVGSSILHILRKLPAQVKEVVIWADSCGGSKSQQRKRSDNNVFSRQGNEKPRYNAIAQITLKFFEKGHNQSEVDTIHHVLEKASKN